MLYSPFFTFFPFSFSMRTNYFPPIKPKPEMYRYATTLLAILKFDHKFLTLFPRKLPCEYCNSILLIPYQKYNKFDW